VKEMGEMCRGDRDEEGIEWTRQNSEKREERKWELAHSQQRVRRHHTPPPNLVLSLVSQFKYTFLCQFRAASWSISLTMSPFCVAYSGHYVHIRRHP